jgi:osmoprotectant transport system substrate-binding protein
MPLPRLLSVFAVVVALAALPACRAQDEPRLAPADPGTVTVGSFTFSESRTLAEIYAQLLTSRGVAVDLALDLASREVAEPALEQGAVDLLPEYLGTALAFLEGPGGALPPDREEAHERLRRAFTARGVTVLAAAAAENKNGFVVTRSTAERLNLRTISDLRPVAAQLVLGGPPECPARRFCLEGLRGTYGLDFRRFQPLDVSGPATVAALEGGEVDVAMLFTSDGHLGRADFVLLEDDRGLQPPENVVPVVRTDVLERFPGLGDIVDQATAELRPDDLVALNRRVDLDRLSPAEAAGEWLRAH